MENDLTFVAPEGVYSNVEDHRPAPYNAHIVYPVTYPTKLSTVVLHYPLSKPGVANSASLPHWQLLGGGGKEKDARNRERDAGREREKEKEREREKEDGYSLSSSDRPGSEEDDLAYSPTLQPQQQQHAHQHPQSPSYDASKLFPSPSINMAKKKPASRKTHNIRTTTSTFVTRIQSVENLNKIVQNKQGVVTYMFFNSGKNFYWTELGVKAKASSGSILYVLLPLLIYCLFYRNRSAASPSLHSRLAMM